MGLGNGDMTNAVWNNVWGDEHRATSPCCPSGPGRGVDTGTGLRPPWCQANQKIGGGTSTGPRPSCCHAAWGRWWGGTGTGPRPPDDKRPGGVERGCDRIWGTSTSVPQDHRGMPSDSSPTRALRHDAVQRGIPSGYQGEGGRVLQQPSPEPGSGVWGGTLRA
jgi:hypothetical protein